MNPVSSFPFSFALLIFRFLLNSSHFPFSRFPPYAPEYEPAFHFHCRESCLKIHHTSLKCVLKRYTTDDKLISKSLWVKGFSKLFRIQLELPLCSKGVFFQNHHPSQILICLKQPSVHLYAIFSIFSVNSRSACSSSCLSWRRTYPLTFLFSDRLSNLTCQTYLRIIVSWCPCPKVNLLRNLAHD